MPPHESRWPRFSLQFPHAEYVNAHVIYDPPGIKREDTQFELFRGGIQLDMVPGWGQWQFPGNFSVALGGERMRLVHSNAHIDDADDQLQIYASTPGHWYSFRDMGLFISPGVTLGVIEPNGKRAFFDSPVHFLGFDLSGKVDLSGLAKTHVNNLEVSTADGSPALTKPDGTRFDFTDIGRDLIGEPEYQTLFIHGCAAERVYPTDRVDLQLKECYLYTRAIERFKFQNEVGNAFKSLIKTSGNFDGSTAVFDQNAAYITVGGRVLILKDIGLAATFDGFVWYWPIGSNTNTIHVLILSGGLEIPLMNY